MSLFLWDCYTVYAGLYDASVLITVALPNQRTNPNSKMCVGKMLLDSKIFSSAYYEPQICGLQ
jgi:hypothetical protein